MKFHKEIGFLLEHKEKAQNLIKMLQNRPFSFSYHAKEALREEKEILSIVDTIKAYLLNFDDVFEIVTDYAGNIEKMGFRIDFNEKWDIIFILSKNKCIITGWTNKKEDKHYTLNKNNYYIINN